MSARVADGALLEGEPRLPNLSLTEKLKIRISCVKCLVLFGSREITR